MKQRILFIGDSITDTGRIREDPADLGKGYPLLLAGKLSVAYPASTFECINRGISGNKILDLKHRWFEDCLSLQPDIVSILIGINDTWHHVDAQKMFGSAKAAADFEKVYREILDELHEAGIRKIVLLEPFVLPEPKDRFSWRVDLDQKIQVVRKLAQEYQTVFVSLDGFLNELGIRDGFSKYTGEDGVHPTITGHEVIANRWLEAVISNHLLD
ncbi:MULTISPECIES: SGNH/GDSL hydrolase family protein [unclassified Enterococcus]|uniref:SGNH/GDSL hydrolase family protein n=1 Tax=unclassified Enterococcus TaxID=2608891 RepID=UPI0013EA9398|nr:MULTISPECIES: SGNH/GDSL hydrolase family protein [unclassified Enterococcus]